MAEETKLFYQRNYVYPKGRYFSEVIAPVYERALAAGIPISYDALLERYKRKYAGIIKKVKKELGLHKDKRTENGVHSVIFLYRATQFTGTLKSSDEGDVYWVPLEEYRKKRLAGGMDQVLKIVADGMAQECWMHLEEGKYREYLF